MANLAGLSHAGAPAMTRGSSAIPVRLMPRTTSMPSPTAVNGRLASQRSRRTRVMCGICAPECCRCQHTIDWNVDTVNTRPLSCHMRTAGQAGAARTKRAYHHGDLERALVEDAVETIARDGVAA